MKLKGDFMKIKNPGLILDSLFCLNLPTAPSDGSVGLELCAKQMQN